MRLKWALCLAGLGSKTAKKGVEQSRFVLANASGYLTCGADCPSKTRMRQISQILFSSRVQQEPGLRVGLKTGCILSARLVSRTQMGGPRGNSSAAFEVPIFFLR